MSVTYRATYLGDDEVVYSFDGAKAWASQEAGRRLHWRETADGKAWYGYKSRSEAAEADLEQPFGFLARIVSNSHPDF